MSNQLRKFMSEIILNSKIPRATELASTSYWKILSGKEESIFHLNFNKFLSEIALISLTHENHPKGIFTHW